MKWGEGRVWLQYDDAEGVMLDHVGYPTPMRRTTRLGLLRLSTTPRVPGTFSTLFAGQTGQECRVLQPGRSARTQ